jgi:ubiquinone/menaquinone biosynthesis C-methylase UbiE
MMVDPMDHFKRIYTQRAGDYHRMITPEDVEGNLLPALESVMALQGKRVLDLGTGTGRLPLLLKDRPGQLIGLDLHAAMLRENKAQRYQAGGDWGLAQSDIRMLPLPSGWAEVITAGWAIGHLRSWFERDWQQKIGRVLREMHRVVAASGALIIIETLTTGGVTPAPPSQALAEYYAWLEGEWGFVRQAVQTDYQFASVDEAIAHTEFFFGPDMAAKIQENNWARIPEWTGVWGKVV